MPSTYQELKDEAINFINNMAAEQTIDTFIDLCEADMSRRVRHWRMEQRATAVLDTQYTQLPSDFYEPIRFSITGDKVYRLQLVGHGEMLDRRQNSSDSAGRPQYVAMTTENIEAFPTPDASYTMEMVYYKQIPALSSVVTTNWVLDYFPDAYLYGVLVHSAPFLGEDARVPTWLSLYNAAIDGINADNERSRFGGPGLRMQLRSY